MPFFMPQLAYSPARSRCYAVPTAPQQQQQCYQQQRSRTDQSFLPFLSLIDEAVNEINRAAAKQQRQIREAQRVLHTRFDVRETEQGYEIDGELPGVEQQDLDIQFSDDQTLTIKGRSERSVAADANSTQQSPQPAEEAKTIEEPASSASTIAAEADNNDTSSVKSYQATVEDDFEDLANDSDVGSTVSQQAASDKGKQRATAEDESIPDPPVSEIEQRQQPAPAETQPEQEQQQQQKTRNWVSERSFGSFSRTFKFPVRVSTDAARASLRNGVLSIVVPKAPVPEVRRIWIQ